MVNLQDMYLRYGHELYFNSHLLKHNLDLAKDKDGLVIPMTGNKYTIPYINRLGQVVSHHDNQFQKHVVEMRWIVFDIQQLIRWLGEALYSNIDLGLTVEEVLSQVITQYPNVEYPGIPSHKSYDNLQSSIYESIYISLMAELAFRFTSYGIYNYITDYRYFDGILTVNTPVIKEV